MSSNLKNRIIFALILGFFYWLSDSIKVSIITIVRLLRHLWVVGQSLDFF